MTEVLYCPINNELLLFTGVFLTHETGMTIFVYANKKMKEIDPRKLVHIGWL